MKAAEQSIVYKLIVISVTIGEYHMHAYSVITKHKIEYFIIPEVPFLSLL